MERYEGKVVLVTGAGGMGIAAVRRLLEEGGKVALTDCFEDAVAKVEAQFRAEGYGEDRFIALKSDVCSYEECVAAVKAVKDRWGRIDTLVNTAGIVKHVPIEEMDEESWQKVIDVNLTGTFHIVKAAVPVMKEQNYGRIVLISSISGRIGRPRNGVCYSASKAGVLGITINLALALSPNNITVNAIAPGPLKGPMIDSMAPDIQRKLAEGIPLGRLGTMEDVAASIAFLGSDDASWITGEVIDINGGLQF